MFISTDEFIQEYQQRFTEWAANLQWQYVSKRTDWQLDNWLITIGLLCLVFSTSVNNNYTANYISQYIISRKQFHFASFQNFTQVLLKFFSNKRRYMQLFSLVSVCSITLLLNGLDTSKNRIHYMGIWMIMLVIEHSLCTSQTGRVSLSKLNEDDQPPTSCSVEETSWGWSLYQWRQSK